MSARADLFPNPFAAHPRANNKQGGNVAVAQLNWNTQALADYMMVPIFPCTFHSARLPRVHSSLASTDAVLFAGGSLLAGEESYSELQALSFLLDHH